MSVYKSKSSTFEKTLNTNKSIETDTALNMLERINENVEHLMRAVAEMHLQLDDVSAQLANKVIRNGQNKSNTDRIKTFLPLKFSQKVGLILATQVVLQYQKMLNSCSLKGSVILRQQPSVT
ncbi:uncharacterized protein LOC113563021 [Ooceraea biroi]|uniref:uncharacterized protein LOC113563021 n=1 Tax=Ooceraea biroi TaxID=2015173 RepID=UPI000F0842A7|nr:uncharacterized protein LOC113563021 [Ooceraea biroi]